MLTDFFFIAAEFGLWKETLPGRFFFRTSTDVYCHFRSSRTISSFKIPPQISSLVFKTRESPKKLWFILTGNRTKSQPTLENLFRKMIVSQSLFPRWIFRRLPSHTPKPKRIGFLGVWKNPGIEIWKRWAGQCPSSHWRTHLMIAGKSSILFCSFSYPSFKFIPFFPWKWISFSQDFLRAFYSVKLKKTVIDCEWMLNIRKWNFLSVN